MNNINYLQEYKGSSIYIKRDDKIPFSYGGNKVRIAEELFRDLKQKGYTAVITYGSPTSNMNRAVADMAKREEIKCYAIIKLEENETPERHIPMNERLVKEAGAEIIYCGGNGIRECVESVLELSKSRGEKPYYIYGSSLGKGNELALMRASYKEYAEIREYEICEMPDGGFDYIVLTAGTGMTISGLAAAMCAAGSETGLIGISAARDAEKETDVIRNNLRIFFGVPLSEPDDMISIKAVIADDYLCGGYGKYNAEIEDTIRRIQDEHGIPLDPVYTGKCFYGMLQEIEKGNIAGNILFIHTGGYPIYQDWMDSLS